MGREGTNVIRMLGEKLNYDIPSGDAEKREDHITDYTPRVGFLPQCSPEEKSELGVLGVNIWMGWDGMGYHSVFQDFHDFSVLLSPSSCSFTVYFLFLDNFPSL